MSHESCLVLDSGERLKGSIWCVSRRKKLVKLRAQSRERMTRHSFESIRELYTPHRDNSNLDDFVWIRNGEYIGAHRQDLKETEDA